MRRRELIAGVAASIAAPRLAISAAPSLGVTLPLTGVQAEVARELEVGYRLAAGESGLDLRILDDESSPAKVAANVRQLGADPNVLALSGIVGTPHAQAGLDAAKDVGLPVVGIRSGAQFLRSGDRSVFHLRSSYEEELDKMVAYCRGAGIERMAILYSDDSFGTTSRDHLVKRLGEARIEVVSSLGVDRNGANIAAAAKQTAEAVRGGLAAVALLLIVKPMVAAATELRVRHKVALPILAMSFTITGNVATSKSQALTGLGLVSAFPLPRIGADLRKRYRMALSAGGMPSVLNESVTAFEGYFYGTVAASAALGAGTRDGLLRKLHGGVSVGELRIDFSKAMVGYQYLEFLLKSRDGLLRA